MSFLTDLTLIFKTIRKLGGCGDEEARQLKQLDGWAAREKRRDSWTAGDGWVFHRISVRVFVCRGITGLRQTSPRAFV